MINFSETFTKPEWVYKSKIGNYEFSLSIIESNILYGKSTGYIHRYDVIKAEEIIQQALDEYLPFNDRFYLVSDLSYATGSSTNARKEHLSYRMKQIKRTDLLLYTNPNTFLKIAIKSGRLFSNLLREKVNIASDLDHALSIIERYKLNKLKDGNPLIEVQNFQGDEKSEDSINIETCMLNLPESRDALEDLVNKLYKEKFNLKQTLKTKTEQLIKTMGEITWGDSDSTKMLEYDKKDEFSDLFDAFNLFQEDLVNLMANQKKEQEKQKKKEKQYETLFNNIADIVLLHDMETHRFVGFNDRALKYGYKREELLSMTPYDLHPQNELEAVEEKIDEVNADPGTGNRWHHLMKDGTLVDVEILTSEIEYNGKPTFASIVRDITDRRRIEKIRIKRQKEAEAASKSKSEFLANMSHEIRTPMNGVIGMLDILLDTKLSEDQQQFAISAQQSADSLLVVINDILDFSKIEAGKIEIETIEFDLSVTLDSLGDVVGIKAFESGVSFACLIENDVPVLLQGDPSRLRQIITNLTGNALKFTEKGEIFLKVSLEKETAESVVLLFEVMDTGIGIPGDKLNSLFESFTQVDASTTRKYGGTGLGLAISKQLSELMGGQIGVKSELNKGSNFYFTAEFEKQTQPRQYFKLLDQIVGKKILVVDDNSTNQKIFKEYLKSWQCRFDIIDNGTDAFQILKDSARKDPYHIALIDMQMPNMSGETLGKLIKNEDSINKIILIMLSSVADRGDVHKLKAIGFAGFLTKPIKRKKLFDTIRAALSVDNQNEALKPMMTSYKVEEIKKTRFSEKQELKILLVEDNKINQKVAKKMLEPMAKQITIAENGKDAIDKFLNDKFDIIFMDVQMPLMDGKEATRQIRELEIKQNLYRTLIIALTANAMKGDRELLIECGADEYLTKPIKKKNLIKIMEDVGLI